MVTGINRAGRDDTAFRPTPGDELQDRKKNLERLMWLTGCDIDEEKDREDG